METLDDEFDLEINPQEINETESRQLTFLLTLMKRPNGLSLEEIRSIMPRFYNNPNLDSDQKKIHRDMEALNELGFSASYSASMNKYYINVDSAESKIRFTNEELDDISKSLIHSDYSLGFSPEVYSLSQKIFGSNWSLYPYFPESKEAAEPIESEDLILDTILHSIKSKIAISIRYVRKYGRPENKELDPIQILRRNSIDLYLYAFDREKGEYRTYLIPCIDECNRLDREHTRTHQPLKEFNYSNPLSFLIGSELEIQIGIQEQRLNLFLSFLKDYPYRIIESEIHLTTTNPASLYPILFKLNRYIQRLEPLEFRSGYKDFLKKLQSMHTIQ